MVPAHNAREHARPAGKRAGVEQAVGPVGVGAVVFLLVAAVRIHVHQHAAEVVGALRVFPAQEHHAAVRQHGGEPVVILVKGEPPGRLPLPVVKVDVPHVVHPGYAGHALHAGGVDEDDAAVRQVAGVVAVRIRRHVGGEGFRFPGFQVQFKDVPGPVFLLAEAVSGEHEPFPGKVHFQMPHPAVVPQQLRRGGGRGDAVKFHDAAAVCAARTRHAGDSLPVGRAVMIEGAFSGRVETPHAHPFPQGVLFRQGFNKGLFPQFHQFTQLVRLLRPCPVHPPVQRPQLLLPFIQPGQENLSIRVPFPVFFPVAFHRAADGGRIIISRQFLQPEKTDSFQDGFLMLHQAVPGRNGSHPLRRNGKDFRQCGPGFLPVRPCLEHGSQQRHRIPAVIRGRRIGKGRYMFRRPRPHLLHPLVSSLCGGRERDSGQFPQPGLQSGSVEYSGSQYGTAAGEKAQDGT